MRAQFKVCAVAVAAIGVCAGILPGHAAAAPAPNSCGAAESDYVGEDGAARTFEGTASIAGEDTTFEVTFSGGRLSEATLESETMHDTVYGNFTILSENGTGLISFPTSRGAVGAASVTCDDDTVVTEISGLTAEGDSFNLKADAVTPLAAS